jgi:hypothetical protein
MGLRERQSKQARSKLTEADSTHSHKWEEQLLQERALPVLASIKPWLDEQLLAVLPKSSLGRALGYARINEQVLARYLTTGDRMDRSSGLISKLSEV